MSTEAMKQALDALEFDDFTPEDLTHRSLHAKSITALKQALALDKKAEHARELGLDYEPAPENCMDALRFDVAARDVREWERVDMRDHAEGNLGIGTAQPAPVQEPFAWCIESENGADWCFAKTEEGVKSNSVLMDEDCIKTKPFPIYTSPPAQEFVCSTGLCHYKTQRQWVGLTDEDFENAFQETYIMGDSDLKDFAKVIEARLKEKNT